MSEFIDREFFAVDLARIDQLAAYWTDSFLAIRNFPAPGFFAGLDPAAIGAAQQQSAEIVQGGAKLLAGTSEPVLLYFCLAHCLARRDFESALPVSARLLERHPDDPSLLFMQGMAHFGRRDYPLAWRNFTRAFALNAQLEHARIALLYMSGFARDHRQALTLAEPLVPRLAEITQWWDAARHIPLIAFQSEFLLRGRSTVVGLDSTLATSVDADAHLAALDAWLPPAQDLLSWGTACAPTTAYFACCDNGYFHRFVVQLILSHVDTGGTEAFHVHVVNPDAEVRAVAERLASLLPNRLRISTESFDMPTGGFASVYYSAARFCRMASFYLRGDVSYYMIDADMLIRRPVPDFPAIGGCHLSRAPAEPLWDHFLAGFGVYGRGDPASRELLCRASNFVMRSIQAGRYRWFLDQVGLFLAAYASPHAVQVLDFGLYCDLEHRDDSYIWAVTNDKNAARFNDYSRALLDKYSAVMTA